LRISRNYLGILSRDAETETVTVGKNGIEKQLPLDGKNKLSAPERDKIALSIRDDPVH
jgi:hypothetical protein